MMELLLLYQRIRTRKRIHRDYLTMFNCVESSHTEIGKFKLRIATSIWSASIRLQNVIDCLAALMTDRPVADGTDQTEPTLLRLLI